MMYAARYGNLSIIQTICGYNIFHLIYQNNYGQNVLHLASRYGNADVVKYLLTLENLDVYHYEKSGKMAVDYAKNTEVWLHFEQLKDPSLAVI